jgi:hypothetical protein
LPAPRAAGGRRGPTIAKREGGGRGLDEREVEREEQAEIEGGQRREGDSSQGRERSRKKKGEEADSRERRRKRERVPAESRRRAG